MLNTSYLEDPITLHTLTDIRLQDVTDQLKNLINQRQDLFTQILIDGDILQQLVSESYLLNLL